jgi:hypothetical protein
MNFNSNKLRIYIGFYMRLKKTTQSDADFDPLHDSIIVLSKPGQRDEAYRFHAINNQPMVLNGQTALGWRFEPASVGKRSSLLKGLLFLGKLPKAVTIERLTECLGKVPIVQGNPAWKCHTWTIGAINVCHYIILSKPRCS